MLSHPVAAAVNELSAAKGGVVVDLHRKAGADAAALLPKGNEPR